MGYYLMPNNYEFLRSFYNQEEAAPGIYVTQREDQAIVFNCEYEEMEDMATWINSQISGKKGVLFIPVSVEDYKKDHPE